MQLQREKTLRREDGSRVKITTTLKTDGYGARSVGAYHHTVLVCEYKKRTWKGTYSGDDYQYRALSMEDRRQFERDSLLKFVTKEELGQAAAELWEAIKP